MTGKGDNLTSATQQLVKDGREQGEAVQRVGAPYKVTPVFAAGADRDGDPVVVSLDRNNLVDRNAAAVILTHILSSFGWEARGSASASFAQVNVRQLDRKNPARCASATTFDAVGVVA